MQFLAPLFLIGLAAVSIPVVLHLIQRERREARAFPSLMFLQKIQHHSVRRRRLRDLPLLLLRVLALVLLAAAFARPLFEHRAGTAAATRGGREVVLLLDRSYSMGAGGRWAQARTAALNEVGRLGPNDRMTVVAFDAGAAALNHATGDAATLRALIERVRPGWGTTRFDPALRLAANILSTSTLPRREVVVVSDLQRTGAGDGLEARLPPGTSVRILAPGAALSGNLAVADVSFRRERTGARERITASARVVNTGDGPRTSTLTLRLGGSTLDTRPVTVAPNQATAVEFRPFTIQGPVQGTLTLGDDALAADNTRYFVLAPGQALPVLLVDGRAGASLFLARALELGGQPRFDVRLRRGALDAADLKGRALVVLDEAAASGASLQRLRAFVQAGGGLLVALGPDSRVDAGLEALLPGPVGPLRDRTADGGATLASIDRTHPVFEVFRAQRSGDLTTARFYRFRPLQVASGADSSVTVLARFDDGSVALAERRLGKGRVLAWASTFDREWNDLAVQPVFVPFVYELAKHAAGYEPPRPTHLVGEVLDARALVGAQADRPVLVLTPDGSRRELAAATAALPLEQSGFYTLHAQGSDDTVHATVAANVDIRESNLAALTPQAFTAAVSTPGPATVAGASARLTNEERERRQSLWWDLLLIAVGLLALETVVSNRRAARRRIRGTT